MARKPRRRSRRKPQPEGAGARLSRGAKVGLATVSTMVGVATGMFTLRDQLFPASRGSALAISEPAYQTAVVRICGDFNDAQRRHTADLRVERRSLRKARTTLQQRDAILLAARRSASRSGHVLAELLGLDPPKDFVGIQRSTVAAWNRILDRTRAYAVRLDRVSTRRQLLAAIAPLTNERPKLQAEAVKVSAGLERLATPGQCDIHLAADIPVPLPPLPHRHKPDGGSPDTSEPTTGGGGGSTPASPDTTTLPSNPVPGAGGGGGSPDTGPPATGGGEGGGGGGGVTAGGGAGG